MPSWLLKGLVGLAGVFLTCLMVAVTVQLLRIYPPQNVTSLLAAYWQTHPVTLQTQVFSYVHVLLNYWPLLTVLLLGLCVTLLMWRRLTDEELNLYMERAYVLEQQVQTIERRERAAADTWDTLTSSLDALFDKASEGWVLINRDGRVRHTNMAFLELVRSWNPKAEHLEGLTLAEIIPGFNNSPLYKAQHDLLNGNKPWYGELQLVPDVWVLLWVWPLGEDMAMVVRDVSHRHRSEAYLQTAEKLSRQLVEDSVRPVAVLDADWKYLMVSHKWSELLGIPSDRNLIGLSHESIVQGFPANFGVVKQQLKSGQLVGKEERWVVAGHEEILSWHIRPWRDAFGREGGFIFTVVPVTELARLRARVGQAQERENALAYSDALTGLPNRQLFHDRLNMSVAQAYRHLGKIALLFLDLDGFKAVNDKLGHDSGDLLLKQVAERLKSCVRQVDTVARLGGDEFTMIISIRDPQDAIRVAEKVIETLRTPFDLAGQEAHIGTSIGIALYPQDATLAPDLLAKADKAMYVAKQSGKNTWRMATAPLAPGSIVLGPAPAGATIAPVQQPAAPDATPKTNDPTGES